MPGWLIVLLIFIAFFAWAGYRLRGRSGEGPEARGDRERRTGGFQGDGGGAAG